MRPALRRSLRQTHLFKVGADFLKAALAGALQRFKAEIGQTHQPNPQR